MRLEVEVPEADVRHALEHAASDLAESARIPGFRKGKVPVSLVSARLGRDALWQEAVRGHLESLVLERDRDVGHPAGRLARDRPRRVPTRGRRCLPVHGDGRRRCLDPRSAIGPSSRCPRPSRRFPLSSSIAELDARARERGRARPGRRPSRARGRHRRPRHGRRSRGYAARLRDRGGRRPSRRGARRGARRDEGRRDEDGFAPDLPRPTRRTSS